MKNIKIKISHVKNIEKLIKKFNYYKNLKIIFILFLNLN
jgi:hypothetical protein